MKLVTLGGLRLDGVDFGRSKPLLLLAYLAVEGPQARRHVAELFWHDAKDPMASLRVALTRLRAVQPDLVRDDGPRLATDVACDAPALLDALERSEAIDPYTTYAGAFLDGLNLSDLGAELEEWVLSTREFLAARVRNTLLAYAERLAERGDTLAAAREAERALDVPGNDPPEPEELVRAYPMLTTHRPARAKRVANELAEYGIEPEEPRGRPAPAAASAHLEIPHNLPNPTTAFVGRTDELATISALLGNRSDRLITLLGPAGVGKTRLSIQIAHEAVQRRAYPDGIYWIGLDAITDPNQISETIASEIGLVLQGTEPPEAQLRRFLARKTVLLVLDNFEQLVDAALLPVDLVTSCPGLTILVTSRARLSVGEERVLHVQGLNTPTTDADVEDAMAYDAVRLFTLRAQRSDPSFRLDQSTLPHVLRVCQIVEGAPLGIELAAAWVRALPIEDIVDELTQGLDRLPARSKDVPDRHQSLEVALEQSWYLLTDRERDVLRRLAVFEGGFRREAASDVAGATLPILASLVDHSLLRLSPNGRYDRHPLVHQFTLAKLKQDAAEFASMKDAHGRYFLEQVHTPNDVSEDPRTAAGLFRRFATDTSSDTTDRVRAELPNLQAAWHHFVACADAKALDATADFYGTIAEQWGRSREGQGLLERALVALTGDDEATTRARALVKGCLAVTFWRLGRLEDGANHGLEGLASLAAIAAQDAWIATWYAGQGAGLCLFYLTRFDEGLKAIRAGYDAANAGAEAAEGALLRQKCDGLAGLSAVMLSQASIVAGDLDIARDQAKEALERMGRSFPRMAAYAYEPLATIDDAAGDLEAMERHAREGAAYAERVGHQVQVPALEIRLGLALLRLGRVDEAHETLTGALRRSDQMGDLNYASQARALLGRALLRLNRVPEAKVALVQAMQESARVATQYALPEALLGCGEMLVADGHPSLAAQVAASVAQHPSGWASTRMAAAEFQEHLRDETVAPTGDLISLVPDVVAALQASARP